MQQLIDNNNNNNNLCATNKSKYNKISIKKKIKRILIL